MGIKIPANKGSLTVEACITFPIFLCFLLFFVVIIQGAIIQIQLDYAVNETAKELAASAYPLALLNEYEDQLKENYSPAQVFSDQETKNFQELNFSTENFFTRFLSGQIDILDLKSIFTSLSEPLLLDNLIFSLYPQYQQFKAEGQYVYAGYVLDKFINSHLINKQKLFLEYVKFPQSDLEYLRTETEEEAFNQDDIVIEVKYEFTIPLPFFYQNLVFKHMAVEKAWLKGRNGVITRSEEGLDFNESEEETEYVYKARTGKKYHRYQHCDYLEKSCITLTLKEALELGLTEHKNCPHRF